VETTAKFSVTLLSVVFTDLPVFLRTLSHSFLHSSLHKNGGRFFHTKTTGKPFTSACYRNISLSLVT